MDEVGTLLPAGEIGEIVVRGPTVMQGYDNNPMANKSAFTHGWFRTGDQGYIDTDGYLFITGRLKEIINRGGEKIVAARSGGSAHGASCGRAGCYLCGAPCPTR